MKMRRGAKGAAVLFALIFCLLLGNIPALAAESAEVKIPVSCTGAACTAVLYDAEESELDRLDLQPGTTSFFTVTCVGLGEFKYSIKLDNADANGVTYDKTVFNVTVTTYYSGNSNLAYAITADPLAPINVIGEVGNTLGKPTELVFENKPGGQPTTVDITVSKTWVGDGPHPGSVSVNLLRSGRVVGSATLSAAGGWKHTFFGLDASYKYSVSEPSPPAGYTPSYVWSGNTCIVVNVKDDLPLKPAFDDPPIRKIVEGRPSRDSRFTFVLTPDDPSYPMPAGSQNGVKEISILGQGIEEIGLITFTAAGHYSYTVRERDTGEAGYTYDDSVFVITYDVTEQSGQLVSKRTVTKDGVEVTGFTAATFTNAYQGGGTDDPPGPNPPGPNPPGPNPPGPNPPGPNPPGPDDPINTDKPGQSGVPQTGDDSRLALWAAAAACSLVIIALLGSYLARQGRAAKEKRSS